MAGTAERWGKQPRLTDRELTRPVSGESRGAGPEAPLIPHFLHFMLNLTYRNQDAGKGKTIMHHHRGSVFFPLLLITAGLVLWLVNIGYLPLANLNGLFYVWPLLLVFLGLDILIGYRARWINALIWLCAMGLTLGLLIYGPTLGLLPKVEVKRTTLSEPIGKSRSATIVLDLPPMPTTLTALEANTALFEASISHIRDYQYQAYTNALNDTFITLGDGGNTGFFFPLPSTDPQANRWDIALAPGIPLNLTVKAHASPVRLDLRALSLRSLAVEAGSGSLELLLPERAPQFNGDIEADSGSLLLDVPAGAAADLYLEGGSGAITIVLEEGCAFQLIRENKGSGSFTLSPNLVKTDEATWETPNFATANRRVVLTLDQGSGALEIREEANP